MASLQQAGCEKISCSYWGKKSDTINLCRQSCHNHPTTRSLPQTLFPTFLLLVLVYLKCKIFSRSCLRSTYILPGCFERILMRCPEASSHFFGSVASPTLYRGRKNGVKRARRAANPVTQLVEWLGKVSEKYLAEDTRTRKRFYRAYTFKYFLTAIYEEITPKPTPKMAW